MKKIFVVSAVNIVDGGALTILSSFIDAAQNPTFANWQFIALVNPSVRLNFGRVKRINFSGPKKSWFVRLYYEYVVFRRISKILKPDVWFSLHDITPNVYAARKFVYCHNPAPFYKLSLKEIWLDPKFFIFNKLYKFFYQINIESNNAVIVQQSWLRDEFKKFTQAKIHISHPEYVNASGAISEKKTSDKFTYIYPAFPRVFKNHVVICEALKTLNYEERSKIKVIFTVSGKENRYASWLLRRYGDVDSIEFRGRLTYEETQELYEQANCVLFPSMLETWGLPLTEAIFHQKKILCSNLAYAKETLAKYNNVQYINPLDINAWAIAIQSVSNGLHRENFLDFVDIPSPDSVGSLQLLKFLIE